MYLIFSFFENVIRIFFKFSYVHWTISFSSVINCSVSLACFFTFRLLVFLNYLIIFSWRFMFMNKGLNWWIRVCYTLSVKNWICFPKRPFHGMSKLLFLSVETGEDLSTGGHHCKKCGLKVNRQAAQTPK